MSNQAQVRQRVEALIKQGKTIEAASLLNNLGARESQPENARRILLEALKLKPDHFESLANLALVNLEDVNIGKDEKLSSLQKALQVNSTWTQGRKAEASLLDDLGREQESIQAYRLAVQSSPNDADCVYDLSLILSKAGSLDEALSLARLAVELNSKHAPATALLAELLWRSGKAAPVEVAKWAKQAMESPSADMQVIYSAAMVAAAALEQSATPLQAVAFLKPALSACRAIPDKSNAILIRMICILCRSGEEAIARGALKQIQCAEDDVNGRRLLDAYLSLSTVSSSPNNQLTASPLCEAFIQNAKLDDARDLVHKAKLYERLCEAGMSDTICPYSVLVTSKEECKRILASWTSQGGDKDSSPVSFLKDPSIQRGQGIFIILGDKVDDLPKDLFAQGDKKPLLLQKAVHPPAVLDGKKFGLRVHALVMAYPQTQSLSVFVFEDAILTKCWLPYSVESNDVLAHVSSTSVQRSVEGFDRDVSKGLASRLLNEDFSEELLTKIRNKIFHAISSVGLRMHNFNNGARMLPSMQVFGFDIILRNDFEPFIAEANASPQFQDSKRTKELFEGFARPMINGIGEILNSGFDGRKHFVSSKTVQDEKTQYRNWVYVGDILA